MIFPLKWFPYIVFFTWPFLVLMETGWPAAIPAEVVWLGCLIYVRHRRRVARGLDRKVKLRP